MILRRTYNGLGIKKLSVFLWCFFLLLTGLESTLLEEKEVRAIKIKGPIKVDGILEESSWQSQGFTGFTQSEPLDGEPATEKTIIWVGYDLSHLYIAARLYDSEQS